MEDYCVIESEKINHCTKDNIVNIILHTISQNKQALVFNNSKSSSEKTAENAANAIKKPQNEAELKKLSEKILKSLPTPTKQCKRLAKIVEKGVAFHHSGLVSKQRSLIENGFKEGLIKVISSTPTLAAGLNLPAYKVIIKDYKRYSPRGFNDIPVLEFHQMSGRAGRPGHENIGKAVVCVKTDDEAQRVVPKYVFGKPEEILSKLAIEPILKMYLLSLISMNMINAKNEIKSFFSNTLYAHQFKDLESLNYNIFKIIDILKDYNFVEQEDDYYIATKLGKKVSELYLNPDTAHYFYSNIDKFIDKFTAEKIITRYDIYSLLYFIVNCSEMKPYFSVKKAEEENYVKKAEEIGDSLIVGFDPFEMDYENFLKTLKLTDILNDWISEAHEDYINDKYLVTPGELNYKIETIDWLLYCLEEIVLLKRNFYFKNFISKIRSRFKNGVKEELLPLVSIKGIGRVRARKLFNSGIKKISDLKKVEFATLSRLIGENTAIKIKEQISDYKQTDINEKLNDKPKEIKNREVTDEEVELLVENYSTFEKEKEENQSSLDKWF